MALERIQPIYCGTCGMPPEFCEFGPDFESHCNPWLKKHHPKLWAALNEATTSVTTNPTKTPKPDDPWTMEQRLMAFYEKYDSDKVDNVPSLLEKYAGKEENLFVALVKKYGPEPDDPYDANEDESDDNDDNDLVEDVANLTVSSSSKSKKNKMRGVGAKVSAKVDTRVVIQKLTRNKKKATTVVVGMETIDGIKLKDVSKTFSKRFAGSSSVKDGPRGKEIIIQGDHMDAVAEMIVAQFGVPGDSVYLDVDGEFLPYQ